MTQFLLSSGDLFAISPQLVPSLAEPDDFRRTGTAKVRRKSRTAKVVRPRETKLVPFLTLLTTGMHKVLEQIHDICVVFFDFSKALDSVPRSSPSFGEASFF